MLIYSFSDDADPGKLKSIRIHIDPNPKHTAAKIMPLYFAMNFIVYSWFWPRYWSVRAPVFLGLLVGKTGR
jgi:hypothetical protein